MSLVNSSNKKLNIDQQKMGLTLGAPEGWTVPVTPFANLVMEYHIN
jgi:hypothetical protein